MTKATIRVLVVDDHPIVRRGISAEINLDPEMSVIGEAQNGLEAVEMARQLKPDVILMDLMMPQMDGVEATRQIIAANPDAQVLILTSFTEEDSVYTAVKAGAAGFIYKDRPPAELLNAIRTLYNSQPILSPAITRRLQRDLREQTRTPAESALVLTDREIEIVKWVAQGALYKEIAQKLGIQEATVRAHVSNILGKLNLSNRSQLVLYAVNHKLAPPADS
ncbi:MAG: response regulator transcription factor [Chloroflexi bacterium]|nr:response regulator transcription factor [Chloroflexota bacterium]